MSSIDNRVVQMSFDNAAFEKRVSETIRSLDKLQQSLEMTNAARGLQDIGKAADKVSLGTLSASVDGISSKFLALSTIAITALSNITNRAVDAGIKIAKSLSLEQVISGYQEYETNMRSIQTILANTKADGTNLQQVNAALDELNNYADLTIYNFAEMARNIGTFTAAGVDLETSTQSIKGIANLAAISGSSSQQASVAMYQLSQAISSGTVRLMDWNSVVNAGMGGEVFQRALFETGKTLGTIADVPIDQTFDQWTAAGNTFRGSLESNWLTSEVLTQTLQNFTGEMTDAQLAAIGYTKEQIAEIQELGQTGVEAATKVRTLTQLIDTTKEAIGSGWAQSFRTVIGDFEEATDLFTGISEYITGIVDKSSDARNNLLTSWANMGGRANLIQGLKNAFEALGSIITPIKDAFRTIFPETTVIDLLRMTTSFMRFTESLKLSLDSASDVRRIFTGVFAVLEIGWEVLKQGVGFIRDLIKEFTNVGDGSVLDFFGDLGWSLKQLNDRLVEGGGIASAFETLGKVIRDPVPYLEKLVDKVKELLDVGWDKLKTIVSDFFKGFEFPDTILDGFGLFTNGAQRLIDFGEKIGGVWGIVAGVFSRVGEFLEPAWIEIRDWFKGLGDRLAEASEPGDYDAAVDTINVGLLGGIGLLLKSFIDGGFGKGFFGRDMFNGITDALEEVSGVLQAMQADLKANALLKIAGAIGILAVSMTLLAGIDSEDLTKSLTAMSAGFAQLVVVFGAINKLSLGPTSAAQFGIVATGMIIISGAILLLSFAMRNLANLDLVEMAMGIGAITILLGILSKASKPLSRNSAGMISAGVSMVIIAGAMNLLYFAVKNFASLDLVDLGKGLGSVAAAMVIFAKTMSKLPKAGMVQAGAGILLISVAMNVLYFAVKNFASMNLEELGKGLGSVAAAMVIFAKTMSKLPTAGMVQAGAGMLLISGAMLILSEALLRISGIGWENLGKGMLALAGGLILMAVAANTMSGALLGAIAIGIMAGSLSLMADVLEQMGNLSFKEIAVGLLAIAAVLGGFALAAFLITPLIPSLLGLGIALGLIGVGFAGIGLGASLLAGAFKILASAGEAGLKTFFALLDGVILRIPDFLAALAEGLLEMGKTFLEGIPVIVEMLGIIAEQLLETFISLIPDITEAIKQVILATIEILRETVPEFIAAGFEILMAFLHGIEENIGEITTTVANIITGFLDAMAEKVPEIIDSVYNLIKAIIEGLIKKLPDLVNDLVPFGEDLIKGMLDGIVSGAEAVWTFFTDLPGDILDFFVDALSWLLEAGEWITTGMFEGIGAGAVAIWQWHVDLPDKILGYFSNSLSWLLEKGKNITTGLYNGIENAFTKVKNFFTGMPGKLQSFLVNALTDLKAKGIAFITGLFNGITSKWTEVADWFNNLAHRTRTAIGDATTILYTTGRNFLIGLLNGLKSKWGDIVNWITEKANWIKDKFGFILEIFSPSRVFMRYGKYIVEGLQIGMEDNFKHVERATEGLANTVIDAYQLDGEKIKDHTMSAFQKAVEEAANNMANFSDFTNPVITPILDLSRVNRDAKSLTGILAPDQLQGTTSYLLGNAIASTEVDDNVIELDQQPREIQFTQNNYSPEALSEADIYRRTRGQLAMAREELGIS